MKDCKTSVTISLEDFKKMELEIQELKENKVLIKTDPNYGDYSSYSYKFKTTEEFDNYMKSQRLYMEQRSTVSTGIFFTGLILGIIFGIMFKVYF